MSETEEGFNFLDYLDDAVVPSQWGNSFTRIMRDGDKIVIRNRVDAAAIDEANREDRKITRKFGSEVANLAARIPLPIYFSLPAEIRDDDHALHRWLAKMKSAGIDYTTTDRKFA